VTADEIADSGESPPATPTSGSADAEGQNSRSKRRGIRLKGSDL
jgi:hypothetical protein